MKGRSLARASFVRPQPCESIALARTFGVFGKAVGWSELENILKTNTQAVITGNAGCSLQLQMQLRQAGHDIWVAHPMDVLDLSYRQQQPACLR